MKKKIEFVSKFFPYILGILIVTFILIQKFSQNDLYFDIRTGKDILKYGIDFKDHFSFIPGLKYLYHHWFYDLIVYFIFTKFSHVGIFIFFYSLFALFGLILFKTNYKFDNNRFLSFITSIITLYLVKNFFGTRVQSISYIIFFLEIVFINKLYDTGKIKYSMILILMSIFLVNIHMPVWILYLVFFLPFITEMIFFKFSKLFDKSIKNKLKFCGPKNVKMFLITYLIIVLSGLISPYKIMPYIFFIKTLDNPYYLFIGEMQKTVLINFLPFLIIVENNFEVRKLNIFNFKINIILINVILSIMLIILYIMCFLTINLKDFNYHEDKNYPIKTIKYINKNLNEKNLRMYNNFNIGSYLAFNDIPNFVDSRAEVFLSNFNDNQNILEDAFKKINNYEEYEKIIKKYNFNYILVEKNENLNSYIKNKETYQLLYNENNKYFLYRVNL